MKVIQDTLVGFDAIEINGMQDDPTSSSEFVSAWGTIVPCATASASGARQPKVNHVEENILQLLPLASDKRHFSCDKCEYRCGSSQTLSRHKRLHSADRKFGCDGCTFRFSRRDTLNAHMCTHYGISKKVLKSAVVSLVRAAVNERKTISARKFRNTIEKEFANDFSALNDMILLTIKATLDNIHKRD